MAIGNVLNGLKSKPIAGKNTGADWNMTVTVVKIPPILMNLILFNSIKLLFSVKSRNIQYAKFRVISVSRYYVEFIVEQFQKWYLG